VIPRFVSHQRRDVDEFGARRNFNFRVVFFLRDAKS